MLKNKKLFEILKSYDTIIPVPISKKRMKERGYNQSLLIAKEISRKIGIKCDNKSLYKKKNIIAQSVLKKEERMINIKDAYELKQSKNIENNIRQRNIILLDDIYTTGSTSKECIKVLEQAKPKKITVLVIAKD